MYIQVFDLQFFFPAWRILNVACRKRLNFVPFCLSKKVYFSFLMYNFSGYKIIGWWFCPFNMFPYLHYFWWKVTCNSCAYSLISKVTASSMAFIKLSSLPLIFYSLIMFYLFFFFSFCFILLWCLSCLTFPRFPKSVVWCFVTKLEGIGSLILKFYFYF